MKCLVFFDAGLRGLHHRKYVAACCLLLVTLTTQVSFGQQKTNADTQLLHSVYRVDNRAFASTMRISNRVAWPIFAGVPVIYWASGLTSDSRDRLGDAYRLTVAEGATAISVMIVKKIVKRRRPFERFESIDDRTHSGIQELSSNEYSFPSGHAAISFSIATFLSLNNSEWYVIAPSFLVASSISLSRIWMGVHYPSDVLAGAAIGTAVSILVHVVGDSLTPQAFKSDPGSQSANIPLLSIRISI